MKSLYLIDNSNFIYRFNNVHTYAKVSISGVEVSTSVLVGYIRCLKQNLADKIMIVLDGVPSKSLKLLPSYKGQRLHDDLKGLGIPKLEVVKFLTKIGVKIGKDIDVVFAPGQEADQVISSLVHMSLGHLPKKYNLIDTLNSKVSISDDRMLQYLIDNDFNQDKLSIEPFDYAVIGTTDSDMCQLQKFPNVLVDTSTSYKRLYTSRTADAVHGLTGVGIILYKSLFGDVSDNVPSVSLKAFSKQSIVSEIENLIKTEEALNEVLSGINTGIVPENLRSAKLGELIKFLFMNISARNEFLRNFDIVNLSFYSIPYKVSYSDYDIDETISKYKLKL